MLPWQRQDCLPLQYEAESRELAQLQPHTAKIAASQIQSNPTKTTERGERVYVLLYFTLYITNTKK